MNEVKYECGGQEYFIDMIGVVRTKDMIMATSDGRLVPRKGRNLKTKIDAGGFLSVMLGKTGKRVKRRICDLLFSNLVDMPVVAEEIKEISDIIFDFKGHSIRSIDGYVGLYDVSTDGVVSSVERSILREDGRRSIKKRYVCKKGISSGGKNFVFLVDKDKKTREVQVVNIMTKTFLGDTPDGMVHSFVDGDKTNDNIMNIKLIKKPASISEKQKLAGEEDNHHDPRLCLDGESWMDIESVDGTYQVSDLGRIRSIDRTAVGVDGYERSHSSRVLKQSVSPDGYRNCQGYHRGKKSLFCVHLVVSRAFMGETPDGFQVDHINEKRYDPRVVNLRFLRQRDNVNRQFAGGKSHVLSEGVMFHHGSFMSKIVNKTVYCSLGSFKLESDAANAYQLAKSRIYENPDIEMTREALIG